MLIRSTFNPLFKSKFFLPLKKDKNDLSVSFPLPTTRKSFISFMASKNGTAFKKAAISIIHRLEAWLAKNDIPDTNLEKFHEKIRKKHQNDIAFELYSIGIPKLAKIIDILESNTIQPNITRRVIIELVSEMDKCEEGIKGYIATAYLKLFADPQQQIRAAVEEIFRGVIAEGIHHHNCVHPKCQIYTGDYIHFGNALINLYGKSLGLEPIQDLMAPNGGDCIQFLMQYVESTIYSNLSTIAILEYILRQLDLPSMQEKINEKQSSATLGDVIRQFNDAMNRYGEDAGFNINDLFDQDALADDRYVLRKDAHYFMLISLLVRLSNTEYLDLSNVVRYCEFREEFAYLIPEQSIKLAFIIFNNVRAPFIPYCVERCKEGNLDALYLMKSSKEKNEFLELLPDLFTNIRVLTPQSLLEFVEWLPYSHRSHFLHSHDKALMRHLVADKKNYNALMELISRESAKAFSEHIMVNFELDKFGFFSRSVAGNKNKVDNNIHAAERKI